MQDLDSKVGLQEMVCAPEGRPERVDIGQGACVVLGVHLAGDGQIGGLGKEVFRIVDAAVRQPLQAAHCARPEMQD